MTDDRVALASWYVSIFTKVSKDLSLPQEEFISRLARERIQRKTGDKILAEKFGQSAQKFKLKIRANSGEYKEPSKQDLQKYLDGGQESFENKLCIAFASAWYLQIAMGS